MILYTKRWSSDLKSLCPEGRGAGLGLLFAFDHRLGSRASGKGFKDAGPA